MSKLKRDRERKNYCVKITKYLSIYFYTVILDSFCPFYILLTL